MTVTIKDVARLAGVSVATVSRVLNGSAPVRADTQSRVIDVARRLRFSPNGAARSLSMRRTHAIGVILPDLYGEFFSELLRGMDQTAQAQTHHLLVSSSHHEISGLTAAVRTMHGRVDGLVVMAPDVDSDALLDLLPVEIPVVLLNGTAVCGEQYANVSSIRIDNCSGAREMTHHLIALGHRRIAFMAGPERNADASERERGHRMSVRSAGLHSTADWQVRGDFTEEGGWRAATQLLESDDRPTAIVCANDVMAIGALSALRAAAIEVPAQMAVAGFDDIPVARYLNPPLTSVRVGIASLGERAVTRLLHVLSERSPPSVIHDELVPTELVVRKSCGPPPATPIACQSTRVVRSTLR